jgi:hypothetical protein
MGDKTKIGMDVGHADNDPMNNDPKNLRNEDPSKNRREPRLREKRDAGYPDDSIKIGKKHWIIYKDAPSQAWWGYEVDKKGNQVGDAIDAYRKNELMQILAKEDVELDEGWWTDVVAKFDQITHPTGWEKALKHYASGLKDPEHRKHPSAWADKVSREYRGLNGRQFIKYINNLVDKGKLPKELKAEYEPVKENKISSFREFVDQIQEKKNDKKPVNINNNQDKV